MDTSLLSRINKYLKKDRPHSLSDTICTYYYENNYLEISFENGQCSKDILGTCTMCNYGVATYKKDVSVFLNEMKRIYSLFSDTVDSLMLCTNGSFMDEKQIPLSFQKKIIEEAANYPLKTLLIETHYSTITDSKLKFIAETVRDKNIKIELGLETANESYQKYILNKRIPLNKLDKVIQKIQSYGFIVSLNILVGIPFLNEKEQIEDVINSIEWCLTRNAEVVLFPLNIKPHTLIEYLYREGIYQPISHWLLIHILSLICDECLSKVDIAYWGNRDNICEGQNVILPSSCSECHLKIVNFYINYLKATSSTARKLYIDSILESAYCDCYKNFNSKINEEASENITARLEKVCEFLKTKFEGRL